MNYPVWQLEFLGGGFLIAVIAIIHVYIAQFAVGGGLFLVLTEHLGRRNNDPGIIDYVRKHTKFFLLLTMVAGALTGVGIWFTISLLSPAATSVLIHSFVFGWATEWTFFVIEIVALFIYYYTFERLSVRNHLIIGWIYFGAAWMSLFVVNGIIGFMLTPGAWLENNSFWSGFFNPTFWPSLFFRTFFSIIIAGLFGFLTASFLKDKELRTTMLRYSAKWLLVPFVLFLAASWWYKASLPPHIEEIIFQKMPQLRNAITIFLVCSPLLILGGLIMAIRMPSGLSRTMAAVMLVIGFMYFGAFEFLREGGRRPYIIYDYMYSNAILKKDADQVAQSGVLNQAKWIEQRTITHDNVQAAGRDLFNVICLSCHSIGGPLNDIQQQVSKNAPEELNLIFATMGKERPYMPPFPGNEYEQQLLIYYLNKTMRR
jgi:cytochrome bd-type quinol oxidase subunit 1